MHSLRDVAPQGNDGRSPRRLLTGAFGVLLVLLCVVVTAAVLVSRRVNEDASARYVRDALPLAGSVRDLVTQAVDEETAVRGFLLTGAGSSLAPYTSGRAGVRLDLAAIRAHVPAHPSLRAPLDAAAARLAALERFFGDEIRLARSGRVDVARSRTTAGTALFDRFRGAAADLLAETGRYTRAAENAQGRTTDLLTIFLIVLGLCCAGLAVALLVLVPRRVAHLVRELRDERRTRDAAAERAEMLVRQAVGLQRFAEALAAARTVSEVAHVFAATGVELAGGHGGGVYLLEGEGELVLVASRLDHTDPADWVRVPSGVAAPIGAVATSRVPMFLGSPDEIDRAYPHLAELRVRTGDAAWATVPLLLGSELAGVLVVNYPTPQRFDEERRVLLSGMALALARALDRARALEGDRRTREREQRLHRLTASLSAAASVSEVARATVESAAAIGADRVALYRVTDDGRSVRRVSDRGAEDEAGRDPWREIPAEEAGPVVDAVRSGEMVVLGARDEHERAYPLLEADPGERAWAALPLLNGGRLVGALALAFAEEHRFDLDERTFLARIGSRVAHAVDRAHLRDEEHEIAVRLQRSLLPTALIEHGQVTCAAYYEAAHERMEVGGDWYETVSFADGRVGLAVGDVVGKGLGAAAAMGALRSALLALAQAGQGPGATLESLSRFAEAIEGAAYATVAYAILDPPSGRLEYATAGHLPILHLPPAGPPVFLSEGRSAPLCGLVPGPRSEGVLVIEPGSTLVLYTDGLVERRRQSLDGRLAELIAVADASRDRDPTGLCHAIADDLTRDDHLRDDVAILCARLEPVAGAPLDLRFPATPEELAPARRALGSWLARQAVDEGVRADVLLAVGEACANAVEHAYAPDAPGDVQVVARHDGEGTLTIAVRDRGRWRAADSRPDRGRGTPLMRALADEVVVETGEDGTHVLLTMRTAGRVPA